MAVEIGEAREKWGQDVWKLVEGFAENMSKEEKPFYIVFACKSDRSNPGTFRQAIKAYYHRPTPMLGILVWYVNHPLGEFRFVPELSAPPDIPLDPELLSNKAYDAFDGVAAQGKKLHAIIS